MQELIINDKKIEDMIYEVRGKQVMLDSDLARLYNTETKVFNQSVKRNIKRFPEYFMFQLTEIEYENLRSQIVTSNSKTNYGGRRYMPFVFTEQGVAMLSGILNSDIAINTSIQIMNAFIAMRKYISINLLEQQNINALLLRHEEDIKNIKEDVKLLHTSFEKFEEKKVINEIYFNGQIYDAYSKIKDILNEAKEDLVIIDGYIDKSILDMIKDINVKVRIITKTKTKLSNTDINKYNSQYNNLSIIYDDTYHDRYIIIDKSKIYHLGASINHAGSRTFSINILEDTFVINSILNKIK